MNQIDYLIGFLEYLEHQTNRLLLTQFPQETIEQYLQTYWENPQVFFTAYHKHGIAAEIINTLAGLAIIRSLIERASQPLPDSIPTDIGADFAAQSLHAGLLVGGTIRGNEIIRAASRKATDAKYKKSRELLVDAGNVARRLWENGNTRLHHEMKQYLVEEFQDENGKHPFTNPILKDKSLLEELKKVAKSMDRPDLISGQKNKNRG